MSRTPLMAGRFASDAGSPAAHEKILEPSSSSSGGSGRGLAIMYGLVITIIEAPCMMAYATIIFRDHYFQAAMPQLVKLVLFSSAVHQLCMALFSSMPFAVGQVQDAGLIFLSSMATTVVATLAATHSEPTVLASVLCCLALCTTSLGAAVWLVGRLKLARLVQFLPMPVIGGYLAFIGWFCIEGGISISAGVSVAGPSDWLNVTGDDWFRVIPAALIGVAFLLLCRRFADPHPFAMAVLPVGLVSVPIMFYVLLACTGISLQEAQDRQWVMQPQNTSGAGQTPAFWTPFLAYNPSIADMAALPKLVTTWLAMVAIVAFSSSLDVAAIELDMGTSIDYDKELQLVGVSNMISGATGGFTGSYIISSTTLAARAGVRSRLCGLTAAAAELIIFALPFSPVTYLPRAFFGGILIFIGLDMLNEWLVEQYWKMESIEYGVSILTFGICFGINLEAGVGAGFLASLVAFVWVSTKSSQFIRRREAVHSAVTRSLRSRRMLSKRRNAMVVFELSGYLFFGSTQEVKTTVSNHVKVQMVRESAGTPLQGPAASPPPGSGGGQRKTQRRRRPQQQKQKQKQQQQHAARSDEYLEPLTGPGMTPLSLKANGGGGQSSPNLITEGGTTGGLAISSSSSSFSSLRRPLLVSHTGLDAIKYDLTGPGDGGSGGTGGTGFNKVRKVLSQNDFAKLKSLAGDGHFEELEGYFDGGYLEGAESTGTKVVILDMQRVTGVDATASSSCFVSLQRLFQQLGIQLLLTGMNTAVRRALTIQGVLPGPEDGSDDADDACAPAAVHAFDTLDQGLEYGEDVLLMLDGGDSHGCRLPSLGEILDFPGADAGSRVADFQQFLASEGGLTVAMEEGEYVYRANERADAVYILLTGRVQMEIPCDDDYGGSFSTAADDASRLRSHSSLLNLYDSDACDTPTLKMMSAKDEEKAEAGKGAAAPPLQHSDAVETVIPGGIFDCTDYFLRRRRLHNARCLQPCQMITLTRISMERLQQRNPPLGFALRDVLDKSMALSADVFYLRALH